MIRSPKKTRAAALLLASGLVLAACGSDSDSADTTVAATEAPAETAAPEAPATEAPAETAAPETSAAAAPAADPFSSQKISQRRWSRNSRQ